VLGEGKAVGCDDESEEGKGQGGGEVATVHLDVRLI
jgi:hypothetical protein